MRRGRFFAVCYGQKPQKGSNHREKDKKRASAVQHGAERRVHDRARMAGGKKRALALPAARGAARRHQRDRALPRAGRARAGRKRGATAIAVRHDRGLHRRASAAARLTVLHQPKFAIWPYFAALEPLYADSQKNAHDRVPEPRRPGAAQGARKGHVCAGEQRLCRRSHLENDDGAFAEPRRLHALSVPVPLARPRADSDRARDRGAQLPGDDAYRRVDLQPARGGGRIRPAHELHRQKSLRPRGAQGHPHFRHAKLAARRLLRHAAHVPPLSVPPAAHLFSERPRGRRADVPAQRRGLRLSAVPDAAERPARLRIPAVLHGGRRLHDLGDRHPLELCRAAPLQSGSRQYPRLYRSARAVPL